MTESKKFNLKSIFHEIVCQLPESKDTQLQICALSDGYEITAENDIELMLTIDKAQKEDLFAASFFVENLKPREDMYISIENQSNLLTAEQHEYANHNKHFTYLLGVSKNQKQIKITLGKGSYRLHNIKFFTGSWENLKPVSYTHLTLPTICSV